MGYWKIDLGKRGEALALSLLKKRGYRILGRNVRARFGEIDLVAQQGRTLCFVEIKAATSFKFGFPEEWVTKAKQRRLSRLARWYLLTTHRQDLPVRFDVVSILFQPDGTPFKTRLIQGAFDVIE